MTGVPFQLSIEMWGCDLRGEGDLLEFTSMVCERPHDVWNVERNGCPPWDFDRRYLAHISYVEDGDRRSVPFRFALPAVMALTLLRNTAASVSALARAGAVSSARSRGAATSPETNPVEAASR